MRCIATSSDCSSEAMSMTADLPQGLILTSHLIPKKIDVDYLTCFFKTTARPSPVRWRGRATRSESARCRHAGNRPAKTGMRTPFNYNVFCAVGASSGTGARRCSLTRYSGSPLDGAPCDIGPPPRRTGSDRQIRAVHNQIMDLEIFSKVFVFGRAVPFGFASSIRLARL